MPGGYYVNGDEPVPIYEVPREIKAIESKSGMVGTRASGEANFELPVNGH